MDSRSTFSGLSDESRGSLKPAVSPSTPATPFAASFRISPEHHPGKHLPRCTSSGQPISPGCGLCSQRGGSLKAWEAGQRRGAWGEGGGGKQGNSLKRRGAWGCAPGGICVRGRTVQGKGVGRGLRSGGGGVIPQNEGEGCGKGPQTSEPSYEDSPLAWRWLRNRVAKGPRRKITLKRVVRPSTGADGIYPLFGASFR